MPSGSCIQYFSWFLTPVWFYPETLTLDFPLDLFPDPTWLSLKYSKKIPYKSPSKMGCHQNKCHHGRKFHKEADCSCNKNQLRKTIIWITIKILTKKTKQVCYFPTISFSVKSTRAPAFEADGHLHLPLKARDTERYSLHLMRCIAPHRIRPKAKQFRKGNGR